MRVVRIEDKEIRLRGQMFTEYRFGRPNYGETPEIDVLEHPAFLELDEPITVVGRDVGREDGKEYDIDPIVVERLHVAHESEMHGLRGRGVEVVGGLMQSYSGHHHGPLVMFPQTVTGIDDRHTFPNARPGRTGTGFFLGHSGLILTCAHVVTGQIRVSIAKGLYRSRVDPIHLDLELDVALLKIKDQRGVPHFIQQREAEARPFRQWMGPQLGERVYAFGYPLRPILPHALNMTEGLVSAEVAPKSARFQVSASIQKGNSGGPLVDRAGNLLGMIVSRLELDDATRKRLPDLSYENVNFAVRSHAIDDICRQQGYPLDKEESDTILEPTALAKFIQLVCVEVETWDA